MNKPTMVGDLVDQVSRYIKQHADTETLEAWAHLVDVFVATVRILDGGDQPIGVCAWCRQPAANWDEAREHIKTCELRRELSDRDEHRKIGGETLEPTSHVSPNCGSSVLKIKATT